MDNQNVSSPCMKKPCCTAINSSHTDQISQLPEDILVRILSLLSLKEAVSTSILSRRWRHLWTYRTSCFDFDISGKMDNLKQMKGRMPLEEVSRFIEWVHRVMQLHCGPYVDELRIVPVLFSRQFGELDRWIRFGMKKGVEKLELDFKNHLILFGRRCILPKMEGFTQFLDISNEQSTSNEQSMQYLLCPRGLMNHSQFFCCLKSLSLRSISVSEEALHQFLSNCVLLEQLCIENSNLLIHVKVTGIRLKYLEIMHCKYLQQLEICSENLISFIYDGPKIDTPFENVHPHLVELVVGEKYTRSLVRRPAEHMAYVPQLETLKCVISDWSCSRLPNFLNPFSEMTYLKHLELEACIRCFHNLRDYVIVVRASPHLSTWKMNLKYQIHEECLYGIPPSALCKVAYYGTAVEFSHYNLTEIEFVGFRAWGDLSMALHLLDIAVMLKKMVFQFEAGQGDSAAIARCERLVKKLPLGVKLVIF